MLKEAFSTAKVSDGDEQNFADRLCIGKGYMSELALVAVDFDVVYRLQCVL